MGTDRSGAPAVACRWCGEPKHHDGFACPLVKALDFDVAGNVRRVEFLTAADFPRQPGDETPMPDYPRKGSK